MYKYLWICHYELYKLAFPKVPKSHLQRHSPCFSKYIVIPQYEVIIFFWGTRFSVKVTLVLMMTHVTDGNQHIVLTSESVPHNAQCDCSEISSQPDTTWFFLLLCLKSALNVRWGCYYQYNNAAERTLKKWAPGVSNSCMRVDNNV